MTNIPTTKEQIARESIFTPHEASTLTLGLIESRRNDPDQGVPLYIPSLDAYFKRMRPGELVVVLGRTSNFKSGLMQYISRHHAAYLEQTGDPRCVMYVTWEQAIEEMTLTELAAATGERPDELAEGKYRDFGNLVARAMDRSTLPMWLMGHSLERRVKRPRLSMSDVERGLAYAADEWGMKPGLIALDYLQRIRAEGGRDERTQFNHIVEQVKDFGLSMGCPVLLGSQAGRQVMQRRVKIPLIEDAKGTGNIEETADGVLQVLMPKTAEVLHSLLPDEYGLSEKYGNVFITEDLLTITAGKRRGGRAGETFAYRVHPEHNHIEEYE